MKPVQIRRPLIKALEKLDLDVSKIPHNMLSNYIRRIKKVVNNKITDWITEGLYRENDLGDLANSFVNRNVGKYASLLKREFCEDVNI